MLFAAMTILFPASLFVLVALVVTAVTIPMWKRRPTRIAVYIAASIASLCVATPLYLGTIFMSSPWDARAECGRFGAGEFVNYTESLFPLSFVLECTQRTVQLIPAWTHPVLALLAGATVGFIIAAVVADRRITGQQGSRTPRTAAVPLSERAGEAIRKAADDTDAEAAGGDSAPA